VSDVTELKFEFAYVEIYSLWYFPSDLVTEELVMPIPGYVQPNQPCSGTSATIPRICPPRQAIEGHGTVALLFWSVDRQNRKGVRELIEMTGPHVELSKYCGWLFESVV